MALLPSPRPPDKKNSFSYKSTEPNYRYVVGSKKDPILSTQNTQSVSDETLSCGPVL